MLRHTILLFIVIFGLNNHLKAAHIIGGDFVYQCLGIDTMNMEVTYLIQMNVYRDCLGGGANFDNNGKFGIFRGSGNNWTYVQRRNSPLQFSGPVSNNIENPCVIIPPNLCVERGAYIFELVLPIIDESYKIVYQRCCRNNTITNIIAPESTGAAFEIEITSLAQMSCNNSPRFNLFPPSIICNGVNINFDHSATDAEGDQIVYEFCAPLASGGTDGASTPGNPNGCTGVSPDPDICPPPYAEVVFQLPTFSSVAPLAGNPVVKINPNTGMITGIPQVNGQYVVGVCATEFRNGVEIGRIRRDFQFNVAECELAVIAAVESNFNVGLDSFILESCGEATFDFINESTDTNYIQNYYWSFDINGNQEIYDSRNVSVNFPGIGSYTGVMILNKDVPFAESCSDTAYIRVEIHPEVEADFSFVYDTCVAGPVTFTDASQSGNEDADIWKWNFKDGHISSEKDPIHLFSEPGLKDVTLIAETEFGCIDSISKVVSWFPVPPLIVIEPNAFRGCVPGDIFFNNLSSPIDTSYDIIWTFGDGGVSTDISPNHVYTDTGIFTVKVDILSPFGCQIDRTYEQLIEMEPAPIAGFEYSPEDFDNFNPNISFFDRSYNSGSWVWDFGDDGGSFHQNPTYTFPDTGLYIIRQIAIHPLGCSDTLTRLVDVVPKTTFYMPNAFTPNNDATNEVFMGAGILRGIKSFKFRIWNRWGEIIFETEDPTLGWNGQYKNEGYLSPPGVYVYTVEYTGPRGEPFFKKGQTLLIR